MEAKDFRIGNWVHDPIHNKADFQIEFFLGALCFQPITNDPDEELTLNIEECAPVPLTEEWLERLGFETNMNGEPQIKTTVADLSLSIANTKFRGVVWHCENGCKWYQLNKNTLYVHQLQNLYHALTGEELTIKEEGK